MSRVNINKVRVIQLPNKKYEGEVYLQGDLVLKTIQLPNKKNCILALNNRIEDYNFMKGTKIPLMNPEGEDVVFDARGILTKAPQAESSPKTKAEKTASKNEARTQEKALAQPATTTKKPNRKPFTPYGLNGYLVDKNGNVRLMLDRRASARTIVLNPTMFSALAEMVQRTQEQKNETT